MSEEPIYVSGLGLVEMYVLIMAMAKFTGYWIISWWVVFFPVIIVIMFFMIFALWMVVQ